MLHLNIPLSPKSGINKIQTDQEWFCPLIVNTCCESHTGSAEVFMEKKTPRTYLAEFKKEAIELAT